MSCIVGLVGKAGSGKDTAAEFLVGKYDFIRMAFADKVKEVVSVVYDLPLEYFNDRTLKVTPHPNLSGRYLSEHADPERLKRIIQVVFIDLFGSEEHVHHAKRIFFDLPDNCSPRTAMQLIGTEGFRAISDTVWIDYVMNQAVKMAQSGSRIVISDVRFPNELSAVQKASGVSIGIVRDIRSEQYQHSSESQIDVLLNHCTSRINNDGTILDLHSNVEAVLSVVYGKEFYSMEERLMLALAEIRDLFEYGDDVIPAIRDPFEVPAFVAGRVSKLKSDLAKLKQTQAA